MDYNMQRNRCDLNDANCYSPSQYPRHTTGLKAKENGGASWIFDQLT